MSKKRLLITSNTLEIIARGSFECGKAGSNDATPRMKEIVKLIVPQMSDYAVQQLKDFTKAAHLLGQLSSRGEA